MTEQRKNHGDSYLRHQWEIASKSDCITTDSGKPVYVTTNRVQSIEGKTILQISTRSSLAVVAIAFSVSGQFLRAKVLLEKGPEAYVLTSGLVTTPVLRIDWREMDRIAQDWAKSL